MGSRSDRSTALRNRDLEGHQGARPKVRIRGGEHIGKFAERITQVLDGRGVQPGSDKSNAISRRWGGSRAKTRKNEERWSEFNRSSSAGEGDVTAEAASPVSGELITAEIWQSTNWPGWGSEAWVACCKAPSGTLKSGAWATPTRSPGSRSATPVKGSSCRPQATKCFCIERMLGCGSMSTRSKSIVISRAGPSCRRHHM